MADYPFEFPFWSDFDPSNESISLAAGAASRDYSPIEQNFSVKQLSNQKSSKDLAIFARGIAPAGCIPTERNFSVGKQRSNRSKKPSKKSSKESSAPLTAIGSQNNSSERTLSLEPPRKNLIKQEGNLCMLYAILNSFATMKEVCQFLRIDEKEELEKEDLNGILDFMRDKMGKDIRKTGMHPTDVKELLQSNYWEGSPFVVREWLWMSTDMDLHAILATDREEANAKYLCTGLNTSDSGRRGNAVENIMQFVTCIVDPEKDAESDEAPVGSKRKTSGCQGGGGKKAKTESKAALGRRLVKMNKLKEQLSKGCIAHQFSQYRLRDCSSTHAFLIYFNSDSVPFRYDPGMKDVLSMLPGNKDSNFTYNDIEAAVEMFVKSLISLDMIYKIDIVMGPKPEQKKVEKESKANTE